ncbi:MAG: hypothetical protein KTR14_07085 [Vampirovibrio sp.]|nr:hypothetical protein [Vampirovibrio sp.]
MNTLAVDSSTKTTPYLYGQVNYSRQSPITSVSYAMPAEQAGQTFRYHTTNHHQIFQPDPAMNWHTPLTFLAAIGGVCYLGDFIAARGPQLYRKIASFLK